MVVKFRASSAGNLLVGGNAITDSQLARLQELAGRKFDSEQADSKVKPLTDKMELELAELIEKRDGPHKFGTTALSYIRDVWLKNNFGYEEPVATPEMLKGIMCEDDAIDIVSRTIPGGFRLKNEDSFEDDHFTGTPDVILDDEWVEDIKCSWTIRTFFDTVKPDPLYYSQGQVYLALSERTRFRLIHVLLDTPTELVEEERKRFFYRFGYNENNPRYIEASKRLDMMHYASRLVPEDQRIKCFEFARNEKHISNLRSHAELARQVYSTLTLGGGYHE